MTNVTHVRCNWYSYGVNLSEAVQELLREKAALYEVTPQDIANDACAKTSYPTAEIIENYARSLLVPLRD